MSLELLGDFHCWSLSAKEGDPAPLRERATLKLHSRAQTLATWVRDLGDQEGLFYLATCHRVELYAWTSKAQELAQKWVEVSSKSPAQTSEMQAGLSHYEGENALAHLMRVCGGLESEVLGETQILGQVKDAARESKDAGWLRGPIDRATQMAFRAAKKIRSQTRIGEGTVSIAHAAVEGLSDVFEDFKGKKVVIVGAGTMALQALEKLYSLGARQIVWINRDLAKIQSHAWAERCVCLSLDHLTREIGTAHVSVLATSAEEPLLTRAGLAASLPNLNVGLQIILDMGLPRNVSEDVHGLKRFVVRNVDEFSDRSMKGHSQRLEAVPAALEILSTEVAASLKDWNHYFMSPALKDMILALQNLKSESLHEIARDLKLDKNPNLEYVIHSVYAKLNHRLLEELEHVQDDELSGRVLEVINRAWRRPQNNGSQKETELFKKNGA